jgi:hypothetical protein
VVDSYYTLDDKFCTCGVSLMKKVVRFACYSSVLGSSRLTGQYL